jgi:hypothetical protein
MAFGGLEIPRAEQGGEHRQKEGHVKGGVAPDPETAGVGQRLHSRVLVNQREAGGDGFQLQRDIGNDAQHGDDRDHASERHAFPIAGADKIRNRRNPVDFGNADDLFQHQPAQGGHQRWTQVDGEESRSGRGGPADAAVKRPRGAVNRQRESVNIGVADNAPADIGPLVTVIRDAEQHPDVAKGNKR